MHLVKWFRKNMTKLMAVFVILIMIAFVMPSLLSQLARPHYSGPNKAMWLYGDDSQISYNDIKAAGNQLTALKAVYADKFLFGQRDLRYILLGQLLFPQSVPAAGLSDQIKQMVMQSRLKISPSQIDDFFTQSANRTELFWILLNREAKSAGCASSPQLAGNYITSLIEQVSNKQADAGAMVRNIARSYQMTEDQLIGSFADMLAVISYIRLTTEVEDVTEGQLANTVITSQEKLSAEFVQLSAEDFEDKLGDISGSQLTEQFDKYKEFFPQIITDDNPYGFGYKQKAKVAVEYMMVKTEDVKPLIALPTEEEVENFYQQNLERFVEELPANANDPNSETVQRQKSYSEVSDMIRSGLTGRKVASKASAILREALDDAEGGYSKLDFETATLEDFKQATKDYAISAEKTASAYGIKIYAGKTGLLDVDDFQLNKTLSSLMLQGQSRIPSRLVNIVFAVPALGDEADKLGPFAPAKPKMYVGIGPMSDSMASVMAVVRVIDTEKSKVPADINYSYDRNLPSVSLQMNAPENTVVLKDKIEADCRKLLAFDIACSKSEQLVAAAKKDGWDKALKQLNSEFSADSNDANNAEKRFELTGWTDRTRMSKSDIATAKISMSSSPAAASYINQTVIYAQLMDEFYKNITASSQQADNLPTVIEFKPQLSCYAVKSLNRTLAPIEAYQQNRDKLAYGLDISTAQSMAFEILMPDNITERNSLRPAQQQDTEDANNQDANDSNGIN